MAETQSFHHAAHWGRFSVLTQDGQIVRVEPADDDPAPSGILRSVAEWVDPAHRISQPMIRKGWLENRSRTGRGAEEFVPVDWDTALGLVASEITRVAKNHGNASIFAGSYGWTSAGRFHHAATLLKRTLNLVGGYTGHVDTYSVAAGAVIVRHALGSPDAFMGYGTSLENVIRHGETLLVFGALAPRTAQNESGGVSKHLLDEKLRRITAEGIKVIHVSPLREDIPDHVGAEWWAIRPNTDTALMLALACEIVAAGRHDAQFLRRCCSGSDLYLAYLRGETDGVPKTAEWASAITGLAADRIRELARLVSDTRTMITVSWALQRAHHGEQPFWAALGLAAVAGQIGKPGGGVGYGYGSLGAVGIHNTASKSPAMSEGRKPIRSFIPVARITDLLTRPGETFTYEGETLTYPDIRLVYWAGGNPYHHHQDLNRLRQAWERPETIIVQDPLWTATAQRADIVLPASTSLERNDIAGHRRSSRLMAMHRTVAPVGQARGDFDIFRHLSRLLGVEDAFTEGRDEMGWIEHLYNLSRQDAARFSAELPSFEEFWRRGYVDVPSFDEDMTYLEAFTADPENNPLGTESGRIVLGSETLARFAHADSPPHPAWIEPVEWLGGETAARHGFHLISHQPRTRLHSQLDYALNSREGKTAGYETAILNQADAARLEVKDGDVIRIFNDRGACLAGATVSADVRESVIVLPTGAWYLPQDESERPLDLSGNPNVLTIDIPSSAFGQGCSAHTCLVSVERYDA